MCKQKCNGNLRCYIGIFLSQGAPKPIAIEPCSGNRAAVLTVFLCLPRGSSGVPPPGQSGKTRVGECHVCPCAKQSTWTNTPTQIQNNDTEGEYMGLLSQVDVKFRANV